MTFDFSFMMFELPEMTKTSLLPCDSFVTYSRRGAYRWHSQVVDTLGWIYKVQNILPFIQHGGWIPARSVRRISGYPRVQLVLHVSAWILWSVEGFIVGTSLFMIYLRFTPTEQDPDKDQWESEFLIDLLFVNTTDTDIYTDWRVMHMHMTGRLGWGLNDEIVRYVGELSAR